MFFTGKDKQKRNHRGRQHNSTEKTSKFSLPVEKEPCCWPKTIRPSCHNGPIEVAEHLYCGSLDEALTMIEAPYQVDVLVPLHHLSGKVWRLGFRGEILYCPVEDYSVLPDDVLDGLVAKILDRIKQKKRVGVFCLGGHGRTGYVAAAVLTKLGIEDPIGFLRMNYCREAVESMEQVASIARFAGNDELYRRYGFDTVTSMSEYLLETEGYFDSDFDEIFAPGLQACDIIDLTCGDCDDKCLMYYDHRLSDETPACSNIRICKL